jgi:hypothetical protein
MPDREEQRRKQAIARDLADDPHWAKELTRRPRTTPAKTPQTIEQAVVSLRRALCQSGPGCGAAAIPQGLAQPGLAPVPSQRTLSRILQRPQKEVPSTNKRLRSVQHLGHGHPAMLRLVHPCPTLICEGA